MPSGHEFTVQAGESVLDAALRQGVTLPYGCRNGTCGSCKGKVVAGQVEYGDSPPVALSDEEIRVRKDAWTPPALKVGRGSLYKYAKTVSSASEGCVTDEL